jgi:hypothetical protein
MRPLRPRKLLRYAFSLIASNNRKSPPKLSLFPSKLLERGSVA